MPLRTARGLQSLDSGKLGTNFRTADPADCVFVVRLIFLWCASINDCWLDFFSDFCRRLGFGFGLGLDAWLENQDELRWLWGRRAEISSQFVCHGESTKKFVKLIRVVPLLVIGEGEDEMIWRFLERDNEYNFRGNFGEDILRAILFGSIRCVIN